MKPIPCIKDKCILLPVCKYKPIVACPELFDWISDRRTRDGLMRFIRKTLPDTMIVRKNNFWCNLSSGVLNFHSVRPHERDEYGNYTLHY